MRDFEAEVTMVKTSLLKPSKKNVRIHTDEQIELLCELISNFGFDQPIVTDSKMVIIKGHGRLMAAKKLKMKEVPVIVRDDITKDFADLSRIVDNDTVEQDWDEATLAIEVDSIMKLNDDLGEEVTKRLDNLSLSSEDLEDYPESEKGSLNLTFKHTCPHCNYRWG